MKLKNISTLKPCLIITYSRPENCINLIDSLLRQGCKSLYVAVDFGKTPEIVSNQQKYEILESRFAHKFEKFEVWRRTENLGVAASVITAIDWFFKYEECGLILEDDLVISTDLLRFISDGLIQFSEHENIFSISGSNFFSEQTPEPFLSEYFIGWGWATWRDRWRKARLFYMNSVSRPVFSFNEVANFWNIGAYRCKTGMVDTWDIELTKYVRDYELVNIIARTNLVSNIGFDKYAANTITNAFPLGIPINSNFSHTKIPINIGRNLDFDSDLKNKVFGIRFKHKFLIFKFFALVLQKPIKTLPEKLEEIILP